jgi:voltage-gated potassium channel
MMHGFRRVKEELAIVGFVAVILMMVSSLAIYEFEHDAQPDKFEHVWDAIWWSFVTLSTVGYGDLVPMTVGGRIIGMLTMLVGIGIFGTFISLVGSSFLATMREEDQAAESSRVPGEPVEEQSPWTEASDDAIRNDLPG